MVRNGYNGSESSGMYPIRICLHLFLVNLGRFFQVLPSGVYHRNQFFEIGIVGDETEPNAVLVALRQTWYVTHHVLIERYRVNNGIKAQDNRPPPSQIQQINCKRCTYRAKTPYRST